MTANELIKKAGNIVVWKRGGKRAPHKPLLILLAIRYLINTDKRLINFSEIENELSDLLMKYGPERNSYRPQYPYWRLKNDGIWTIPNKQSITENSKGDVSVRALREKNIEAGFTEEIFNLLQSNPTATRNFIQFLLDENFPYSLHNEILEDIGLDLRYTSESLRRKRDPHFRHKVLNTYDYKCAICGYDLRFYNKSLALEAAHIKWHKAGGPDVEENGVALCNLHHKLFDFGAIALDSDRRLIISGKLQGSGKNLNPLLAMHRELINEPSEVSHFPKKEFTNWHLSEVFKNKNGKSL